MENKNTKTETNSVINEIIKDKDEIKSDKNKLNFETNISLPNQSIEFNINLNKDNLSKNLTNKKINNSIQSKKTSNPSKFAAISNSKTNTKTKEILENKNKIDKDPLNDQNVFYISPPKLDKRVSNFRFISSLDNELLNLENVFNKLDIKLKDKKIFKVSELTNKDFFNTQNEDDFLVAFRQRLDLLAIYKNALEFIPLKAPMVHYYVTSKYGKRKHPVTKKWRFHHGIDLAGTWQENIKVSADGVVTFAGYHGSFGKVIRIRHNYGINTTYGHLAKILVKKGQIVSEGQIIGKMGRTGRVDGAHLHYEISVNGKSKDPAIYFKIGRQLLSRNSFKSVADID